MFLSVFDLFSVGIGPSSSHTVGPMRAARTFATRIVDDPRCVRVTVHLYGSLAATGRAHGTHAAVVCGLEGERPETVAVAQIPVRVEHLAQTGTLALLGRRPIAFDGTADIVVHRHRTPAFHPNALRFAATASDGTVLQESTFYSVGGGFVLEGPPPDAPPGAKPAPVASGPVVPLPFSSAEDMLQRCGEIDGSPADVVRANEQSRRAPSEVRARLLGIWDVMQDCVRRGLSTEGVLPGFLALPRRAPALYRRLSASAPGDQPPGLAVLEWIDCYALAVSEENAAGGRIVTAPTNGAAGIIPAVLHYYRDFVPGASDEGVVDFLLTAAAIGALCKENASISGAEVGCQGEVGSACAMAAAGLCHVLGGTPAQVENAAEIGIEHHLGLTCDPVGGLVQIPCIERNAVAAVKAVNAAEIALSGNGRHAVSLDVALATMRRTGADMKDKYKETARGGLALSIPEC